MGGRLRLPLTVRRSAGRPAESREPVDVELDSALPISRVSVDVHVFSAILESDASAAPGVDT